VLDAPDHDEQSASTVHNDTVKAFASCGPAHAAASSASSAMSLTKMSSSLGSNAILASVMAVVLCAGE